MEKEKLLTQWCDSLIKRQLTDLYDEDLKGGFLCPACKTVHGRGDNAIYPFYYLYSKTKDAVFFVFDNGEKVFEQVTHFYAWKLIDPPYWTEDKNYVGEIDSHRFYCDK